MKEKGRTIPKVPKLVRLDHRYGLKRTKGVLEVGVGGKGFGRNSNARHVIDWNMGGSFDMHFGFQEGQLVGASPGWTLGKMPAVMDDSLRKMRAPQLSALKPVYIRESDMKYTDEDILLADLVGCQ